MHRFSVALGAFLLGLAAPASGARPHYIDVQLLSEAIAVKPGQTILLGFKMVPRRGWHGYWSNPGESGLAPVVKWKAPRGVRLSSLRHPAPTLMRVMGMTSFVHSGPHILLATMTVDRGLRNGTALPIIADLTWAACSDRLCVPEKARLALNLKVGNAPKSPQVRELRTALSREPARLRAGTFTSHAGRITLRLPANARLKASHAHFFPDSNGYWDPVKARVVSGKPVALASPALGKPPQTITGVVSDGVSAYRLSFRRQ